MAFVVDVFLVAIAVADDTSDALEVVEDTSDAEVDAAGVADEDVLRFFLDGGLEEGRCSTVYLVVIRA